MADNDVESTNSGIALGRIEGKLDIVVFRLDSTSTTVTDHERRIRTVEKWMYAIPPTLVLGIVNGIVLINQR